MAAYYRVYDSRHLQADCQEPGSAPGPYARQSSMGYLYLLCLYCCVFCVSAVSRPIKIYTNESNKVVRRTTWLHGRERSRKIVCWTNDSLRTRRRWAVIYVFSSTFDRRRRSLTNKQTRRFFVCTAGPHDPRPLSQCDFRGLQRQRLVAWHSGRTSVSDWRTFPVLRSTCSWWVITNVGKPSATGQPTRPTQPFILSGSIKE